MAIEPDRLDQSGRELAAILKRLRKQAGLSGVRLAARCNMSQSKISRIEGNKSRPSLLDVEQLLRGLHASPAVAAEVMALARIAQTEWQDGRALRRKGLDKKQVQLAGLEASSTTFRYFLLSMITGLLATPEYIRSSLAQAPSEQQAKAVAMKLDRQRVLFDRSKRFTFILTEQAVRYPLIPPDELALQIDRLASLTHQPNIRLGVIPMGVHFTSGALNTFTVYDETLATAELDLGAIVFRDGRDVQDLILRFTRYEDHALFGEQAREKLTEWAAVCRS
ncbi:helix-turn-helix domain-containing protein [Streptomyces sp. AV19]|uniref:Scr1 family TA system antitoxin-like transcriptional regulator n=1 Tax=Streptomyces sp. AV19 TaxID=2793068 RepID=UPI0018FE889E|nr:Scr1 family TA system antitoxin-like transcriptional regulator [Streptomyces sp. AV19]MBH1933813.1 helix-turn-helix domain-containing protein [Streptomyces sp. AV19]MDG4535682.1 helix-turn-helix domain-containing protein [Streptomyces sp. AV19]